MAPRGYDKYFIVIGAGRNRKFVRFTDSERCAHVFGVLSLAAQSPKRGFLLVAEGQEVGPEEVSNEAGGQVTVRVAQTAIEKLKKVGVLRRDDEVGAWYVNGWWDVNPDPRNDTSNAERQRRYRERHNGTSNGSSNAPNDVTVGSGNTEEVEVEVEVEVLANARTRRDFRSDPNLVREDLKAASADQRIELLSELLAARIVSNDPKAKVAPFSKRWLIDTRLLLADRSGDWQEVADVIDWCQADSFWRCNILSPSKLRKQFTQLRLKGEKPRAALSAVPRNPSAGDLIDKINEGKAAA